MDKQRTQMQVMETVYGNMLQKVPAPHKKKCSQRRLLFILMGLTIVIFLLFILTAAFLFSLYSAFSSQMLELKKNLTETRNEVLAVLPNAQVEMEHRLIAGITTFKEDIRKSYGDCQKEWKLIGSILYYISPAALTWEESKNVCIILGSTLLILENQKEMEDLQPLMKNLIFWIGMSKKGESWQWLDSSIPTFQSWFPNEPNNSNGEENCVEVKGRLWNDIKCSVKRNYICKKKL